MEKEKKIYIIDGNSLLFRAYYATVAMSGGNIMRTKDGVPTNAIYAFANMISKILSSFKGGESIFVAFDMDSHTFRKEEFEDYKANRKPCPEDLIQQFPISREMLDAFGILHYEAHGIEADDIAGTMAKLASKKGYRVELFTSDKDYLQLIDEGITVNILKTGLSNMDVMTPTSMKEKYGFDPLQIIDYKGLRGDASDNLPGVPGIGEKTAVKLIQQYGNFENIIAHASEIKGKAGEAIKNGAELGRKCYHLATIKTDCELPYEPEDCYYNGYEFSKANAFANKYEFKTMLSRLPIAFKKADQDEKIEVKVVHDISSLNLQDKLGLAIDVGYEDYHTSDILGFGLSDGKKAIYLSIEDAKKDENFLALLKDKSVKKNTFDAKLANYCFARLGMEVSPFSFDALLASYLLDSSGKIDPISVYQFFGFDILDEKEEQMSLFEASHPSQTGLMAYYALKAEAKAMKELEEIDSLSLYQDVELPLSSVLSKMEFEGFPLDGKMLLEIGEGYKKKVKELEKQIHELAGYSFNIASPKQVGELLYDKLGLGDGKERSTSVDTLKYLSAYHPIVSLILEYRKYAKLVSTYIDGFLPHIASDQKIHTYFNQAQTTTGRLSSSNPNMQNISARDEEGKQIKKAFYYEDGYQILSLDYSQIELRVLASLSHCKSYIEVFNHGHDVHEETAKKIFGYCDASLRRKAKAVNFAIIYGTTAFGLSDQIGCSVKEAKKLIDDFYSAYPEIGDYLSSILKEAETNGYVKTIFGRRRYLRDINDANYAKREAAKRQSLNAPVQGSAADLMKVAMLKVDQYLESNHLKTKMVLQIHDELLFKVPNEEVDIVKDKIKEIMENALPLDVKLNVEGNYGSNWLEAK